MRAKLAAALGCLVTLATLCLLAFRILLWRRSLDTLAWSGLEWERVAARNDTARPSLAFCNANPLRATALYSAGVYDRVSQAMQDSGFSFEDLDLSTDQLLEFSHTMDTMLKRF
uniref:Acid phosphatase n=1 Tax=Mesocestoides corti TaxID=53468 RepID=A0A5K3EYT5_MESCO